MLDKTILELKKVFTIFNEAMFEGELETPTITIQSSGRTKSLAWCSVKPIWQCEGETLQYEINISAEALNRDYVEICHSMLHEMCHLYNNMNGIKDCSGKVHNKKFKETAENFGLECEKEKGFGWGITTLKPVTKKFIEDKIDFDESVLKWSRVPETVEEKEKKTTYKYTCPDCGNKFSIKYEIEAKCKDCGIEYSIEVKEPPKKTKEGEE